MRECNRLSLSGELLRFVTFSITTVTHDLVCCGKISSTRGKSVPSRSSSERCRQLRSCRQQLAAVRRLAYEAADAGLLSPELAAGIARVKGVRSEERRVGEEGR